MLCKVVKMTLNSLNLLRRMITRTLLRMIKGLVSVIKVSKEEEFCVLSKIRRMIRRINVRKLTKQKIERMSSWWRIKEKDV